MAQTDEKNLAIILKITRDSGGSNATTFVASRIFDSNLVADCQLPMS